jgi:hypothetical protein
VTTVGLATAGDDVFVAEIYTQEIRVHGANTGQEAGYMTPDGAMRGPRGAGVA